MHASALPSISFDVLLVYDTMEKFHLKQVTDASRQWSDLIVAHTQHYWAIPVNRCTPPRRSKLINLKGQKYGFLEGLSVF